MFPFQTLRAMVGGQSAIDVQRLQVRSLAEGEAFMECYGYRWSDPDERDEIEALRRDALVFIDEVLLEPGERIPDWVREETDVRALLMAVSGDTPAPWACGLLRVMHTLAHARSDFTVRFAAQIEDQILGRFEPWLRREASGVWLGDVPLVRFEARERKALHSLVLKLLHKTENVAADIFDRLGLRFVTRNRLEALLVVRFLRSHNVVMFANVKPSRSKNTLVDLERLETRIEGKTPDLVALADEVESWPYPDASPDPSNPYSSRSYHAIQFTARQRVRVTDEAGEVFRFFFPFEIQILDEPSFVQSRVGFASHEEYKARQRDAARLRVLGEALGLRTLQTRSNRKTR